MRRQKLIASTISGSMILSMVSGLVHADVLVSLDEFKDYAFRSYIAERANVDVDEGYLDTDAIESITSINLDGYAIESLEGIENLTALEDIDIRNMSIVSADLSSNTKLKSVIFENDYDLEYINVYGCTNLSVLWFRNCDKITTIDISSNPRLVEAYQSNFVDVSDEGYGVWYVTDDGLSEIRYSGYVKINSGIDNPGIDMVDAFPNDAFRMKVAFDYDINHDLYLNDDELAAVKAAEGLYVGDSAIDNLAGIEFFENLSFLGVVNTSVEELDLSSLENLTTIDIQSNSKLNSLIMSDNLVSIFVNDNNMLEILDLANCSNLDFVDVSGNMLYDLILPESDKLTYLDCSNNSLLMLDVSGLSSLDTLICSYNNLENLSGLEFCSGLGYLDCAMTHLQAINLSNNAELTILDISNTGIREIDISNIPDLLVAIDSVPEAVSDAGNAYWIYIGNVIGEDEYGTWVYESKLHIGSNVSVTISNDEVVTTGVATAAEIDINKFTFPDGNFRDYVLANIDLDHNEKLGYKEIKRVTELDLYDLDIADMQGIGFFKEVFSVIVDGNPIDELNLSDNHHVGYVGAGYTELTSITLADDAPVYGIVLSGTPITSFDASKYSNLEILNLEYCESLTSLTINNERLYSLIVYSTSISSLDISHAPHICDVYHNGDLEVSGDRACYLYGVTLDNDDDFVYDGMLVINSAMPVVDAVADQPGEQPGELPSRPQQPEIPNRPNLPEVTKPIQRPIPTLTIEKEDKGVGGFVERLYEIALGRPSDSNGKQAWLNVIANGETGAEAAKGFLFSDEFLNKDIPNDEFVKILYRTFFDREADANGLAGWIAALERGESKQDVIMGFIDSTEWANVCLNYGIRSGGQGVPSIEIQPNQQVIDFATRLYSTCLNRKPDQKGLEGWARQLANLRDSGSNAAHGFFFSDEMNNASISNDDFVTRLYRTFMGRNPDQAGFDAWVAQLDAGVSREEVFQGFAQSEEFGKICISYGIIR